VVVVGSASRDLDTSDPRGWRLGGGATYGALVLARLGLRVGVVLGVDAPAAEAHELDLLRDAGTELRLVRLPTGPVFQLTYTRTGRTVRCEDPGGPMPVAALPPAWRAASGWYLAPIADELPDGWAAIPPGAVVALGWQGLLRDLERGAAVRPRPPGPRAILRRADLVSVSAEDLDPGTDLRGLLRLLRTGTLCTFTRGSRGGIAFAVRPGTPRMRRYPALPSGGEVDTTGAGDAFLASLLAARIAPALAGRQPHLPAALRFAAAVAAVHVGGLGLAGVPTLAQVRDALRQPPPG
jgi:sugar/nucleoside kinase (ribokinase family)